MLTPNTTTEKNVKNAQNNVQVKNTAKVSEIFKAAENAAKYKERMRVNMECGKSLSKVWATLQSIPTLSALLAGAKFKDFASYMKGRYNITDNSTPKHGWSLYYALQWSEKYAKQLANNGDNLAKSYLNSTLAELKKACK